MSELLRESNMVELKKELNDKLEKEVVAFLNYKEGGDIYIGVDDDGNAVALDNLDAVQCAVADRIKNNIQPTTLGLFDVVKEKYQGKSIIHIVISSGVEKPYFIKRHGISSAGCYIRIGTSSQPMPQSMIDELYAKRTHNSLQKIVSPRQNLTFAQLQIYYQAKGMELNDKFAENLDLLTEDGKYNYAAYLLADSNGVSMKVAKYAGKDKCELIENEEYGYCSLIKATNSVLDRLNVENRTLAKITSKERIEKRLINAIALREAVINAVVHNDYSLEVPPVFEIFSDRIEITSYGGLPMGLSKEDFFGCRSMPRNRELMRVFKDMELVEQLGSGMARILSAYDKNVFSFTSHFITARFDYTEEFSQAASQGTPQAASQAAPQANSQSVSSQAASQATNQASSQATPQASSLATPQANSQVTPQAASQATPQAGSQALSQEEISKLIVEFCKEPRTKKEIADQCGITDIKYLTNRYLKPLLKKKFLCTAMTLQAIPQDSSQDEISKLIIDFCKEPRTKKEIADQCRLTDLKHLTSKYLKPMLEQHYLRLTIPEKPKSPNQKYIAIL